MCLYTTHERDGLTDVARLRRASRVKNPLGNKNFAASTRTSTSIWVQVLVPSTNTQDIKTIMMQVVR